MREDVKNLFFASQKRATNFDVGKIRREKVKIPHASAGCKRLNLFSSQSRQRRVYLAFGEYISLLASISRFWRVYHQAAGKYTLVRDEIQERRAALDDMRMIYQAEGLSPAAWIKKFRKHSLSEFFGAATQI